MPTTHGRVSLKAGQTMNIESIKRLFGDVPLSIKGYATGGFNLVGTRGNYEVHVVYTPENIYAAMLDAHTSIDSLISIGGASIWISIKMAGITIFDDEIGYTNHIAENTIHRPMPTAAIIQFPVKRVINA